MPRPNTSRLGSLRYFRLGSLRYLPVPRGFRVESTPAQGGAVSRPPDATQSRLCVFAHLNTSRWRGALRRRERGQPWPRKSCAQFGAFVSRPRLAAFPAKSLALSNANRGFRDKTNEARQHAQGRRLRRLRIEVSQASKPARCSMKGRLVEGRSRLGSLRYFSEVAPPGWRRDFCGAAGKSRA